MLSINDSLRVPSPSQFTVGSWLCPLAFLCGDLLSCSLNLHQWGRSHLLARPQEICGELTHPPPHSLWLGWADRNGPTPFAVWASSSLSYLPEPPSILNFPGEGCHWIPALYQTFVNTTPPLTSASQCHLKSHEERMVVPLGIWRNLAADAVNPFSFLTCEGRRKGGRWQGAYLRVQQQCRKVQNQTCLHSLEVSEMKTG